MTDILLDANRLVETPPKRTHDAPASSAKEASASSVAPDNLHTREFGLKCKLQDPKLCRKAVAAELADIIQGISVPVVCGGTENLAMDSLTVQVKDRGLNINIKPPIKPAKPEGASYGWNWQSEACKLQADSMKPLTSAMPRAAFGHGCQTKHDPSVRDALQLQSRDFDVNFPEDALGKILQQVKSGLRIETDIIAEMYSLNVYCEHGKFLKHKDTPRGEDMIGTLVVCLPSYYTGGAMKVTQELKEHVFFDGGSRGSWYGQSKVRDLPKSSEIKWCAFYADIDHEIQEVTGGVRITLAYLLRRCDQKPAAEDIPRPLPMAKQYVKLSHALKEAMEQGSFLSSGGRIAFPCFHLYTNTEVFPGEARSSNYLSDKQIKKLKGRDAVVANAASITGLQVSLVPFLSHDYSMDGSGDFKLAKFPPGKRVPRRMSDDTIENHFNAIENVTSYKDEALWIFDIDKAATQDAGDTEWNAEGYFGNEASGITFYVRAALYVEVPEFRLRQEVLKQIEAANVQARPEDFEEEQASALAAAEAKAKSRAKAKAKAKAQAKGKAKGKAKRKVRSKAKAKTKRRLNALPLDFDVLGMLGMPSEDDFMSDELDEDFW